jgi:hypothetical protein
MIAAVGRAGCSILLSEDMQDGAVHDGVTLRNPCAGDELPDLEAIKLAGITAHKSDQSLLGALAFGHSFFGRRLHLWLQLTFYVK